MNIVIAIIILGVLIFIHELGHFLVAKLNGVYVEKFSLGFGPRLLGRKIGETDYCLSAFPLGGYVKMYGEQPEEEIDPSREGRAFSDKKPWQRASIILAGPFANVLLAVVVFWGLFMSGYPDYPAVIGDIKAGSPAAEAGLAPGDMIVSSDGVPVRSWSDFQGIVADSPGKTLNLTLADGRTVPVAVAYGQAEDVFGDRQTVGEIGALLHVPAVIGAVHEGAPAGKAGLMPGDKIVSINSQRLPSWNASAEYIRKRPGEPLKFEIDRAGETLILEITPEMSEITGENGEKINVGLIGINPKAGDVMVRYGFFESMVKGFEKSYEFTALVFKGFVKLVQRAVPADSLGGPIMIVQMAADSAQSGSAALLTFMAVISLNLAVFNLLPIPALDGGHLLIIIIESVTRRRLSERVLGNFQMVGFALLMCLMVFAFYNDLSRIFIK